MIECNLLKNRQTKNKMSCIIDPGTNIDDIKNGLILEFNELYEETVSKVTNQIDFVNEQKNIILDQVGTDSLIEYGTKTSLVEIPLSFESAFELALQTQTNVEQVNLLEETLVTTGVGALVSENITDNDNDNANTDINILFASSLEFF